MIDLIANNPFRIVGIYVGDSPAAEQKNLSRIRMFEKVGQYYDIPLKEESVLPKIERTEKSVTDALRTLSLPQDRVRYALFWFSDGSTEWGQFLNNAVQALIRRDFSTALVEYNRIISDDSTAKSL